ncbi:hypothetical protein [Pelagicoccus sp. SDUM812002]|uniref:hypothetical protein n=1 Tax=Pelagicoccus sp. SDUM812002 TaxID=3041266 RepID=UPI00280E71A2|nr:hypothetical protein [Pelagicoccus sp. SDUM812002]MDQ8184395.1 hypothetical protein [Pelagicoccus sp. SDUM812002]
MTKAFPIFPSFLLRRILRFEIVAALIVLLVGSIETLRAQDQLDLFAEAPAPPSNRVFEYRLSDFDLAHYSDAVEDMINLFEQANDKKLQKGEKGRVGLKVYSDSGPGLSTPEPLVEAVVLALEKRGFVRNEIFIIGMNAIKLRDSGFLPPLSKRAYDFHQVFVRSLDSGQYYHEKWFYDSPLPAKSAKYWIDVASENPFPAKDEDELARKSYLPVPLLHEVDFWINLPCYSDHPVLGVNGALMNATLWNASNTTRFLNSPANAPVAVAEMGAIPELRETWQLNIVSLERYQYIGGPIFNSLYTVSEPYVLLSDNPVMLDSLMAERINRHRSKNGFAPLPEQMKILEFSEQLGLGDRDIALMDLIRAN